MTAGGGGGSLEEACTNALRLPKLLRHVHRKRCQPVTQIWIQSQLFWLKACRWFKDQQGLQLETPIEQLLLFQQHQVYQVQSNCRYPWGPAVGGVLIRPQVFGLSPMLCLYEFNAASVHEMLDVQVMIQPFFLQPDVIDLSPIAGC